MSTPLSLYIHIPFCVRKCAYCDFFSAPAPDSLIEDYADALVSEIRREGDALSDRGYTVPTVFFGGGTPSLLTASQAEKILEACSRSFSLETGAEITMEANPGTLDLPKLRDLKSLGISRLSLGVQSFDDQELALLGRIHRAEDARNCVELARKAGFANLSLDLMSALPGQKPETLAKTLEEAVSLEPEHISCYSLILEEGTAFARRSLEGSLPPFPGEDEEAQMDVLREEVLARSGYVRYEISNYAKPGFASRHNIGYWTGRLYLGFGAGAASLLPGDGKTLVRHTNVRSTTDYIRALSEGRPVPEEEREVLDLRAQMSEAMFLGLRMTEGVSRGKFYERFGCFPEDVFGEEIARHRALGLLAEEDGRLCLTGRGLEVANAVMCDFVE